MKHIEKPWKKHEKLANPRRMLFPRPSLQRPWTTWSPPAFALFAASQQAALKKSDGKPPSSFKDGKTSWLFWVITWVFVYPRYCVIVFWKAIWGSKAATDLSSSTLEYFRLSPPKKTKNNWKNQLNTTIKNNQKTNTTNQSPTFPSFTFAPTHHRNPTSFEACRRCVPKRSRASRLVAWRVGVRTWTQAQGEFNSCWEPVSLFLLYGFGVVFGWFFGGWFVGSVWGLGVKNFENLAEGEIDEL